MKESTNGTPAKDDLERYRENYLSEQEGVFLYRRLADVESDAHLAELYRRHAAIEQRHAAIWKGYLEGAGESPPAYTPNWRVRALLWIAKHLGTGAVLSTISSMESNAMHAYDRIGLEPAASHWVSTQVVRCVFVGPSPDPLRINHRFFRFLS